MGKTLEDENAIVDIRAAMSVLSEKLRVGQELSEDIHATYDKILEKSEYLKQSLDQIGKLERKHIYCCDGYCHRRNCAATLRLRRPAR